MFISTKRFFSVIAIWCGCIEKLDYRTTSTHAGRVVYMKARKKHQGMKAKIRAEKKRERHIATAITIATILIIIVISAYFVYSMPANNLSPEQPNEKTNPSSETLYTIPLGMSTGRVTYDPKQDYFFIEVEGARLPFKTDPREALEVPFEAPGGDEKAKISALLLGMMDEDVRHVTILINPDEENEVTPAVDDLKRYVQMVNSKKYNGIAYTKSGGQLQNSVIYGGQIQSLDEATPETPIILIKGPKSGAESTRVAVLGDGKFLIEGETYEDTYKAADFVSITLVKMLCGSADCPDAASCATGGDCGC